MGDVYINMNEICPLYARIWDLEKKKTSGKKQNASEKNFFKHKRKPRREKKKHTQSSL